MADDNVLYLSRSTGVIIIFATAALFVLLTILFYFFWIKPLSAQITELKQENENLSQAQIVLEDKLEAAGLPVGK